MDPAASCWHGPGRHPATRHSPSTWIRRSARHTVAPAVGRGRWHRRRAVGPAARGPAGALRRGQGTTHGAGKRLLHPRHRRACRRMDVRFSIGQSACAVSSRPYPSRTAHPLLDGGRRRVAETSHTPFQSKPRRAGAAHRPAREPTPGSQLALFATYSLRSPPTAPGWRCR